MSDNYLHGSMWRRWDLHLHTPDTKKEDRYSGSTSDAKWEGFYRSIADYVGDGTDPLRAICAIGVTDYLSIDNYFKVKNARNRLPSCIKLILPNIEVRMIPTAKSSPINLHFIFNPDFDEQIESQFLSSLYLKTSNDEFNATKEQLVRLGRIHNTNKVLSDEDAYKIGINQFILEPDVIRKVLKDKKSLRDNCIIAVCNKSTDGVSGARCHCDYLTESGESQLQTTTDSIYQMVNAIFSSNNKDVAYFLGNGASKKEEVLRRYISLKPCIHGCDAHENDKIFAPDEERFCWIKADPTFEGLKQILYEPKDRVFIGSTYPSLKADYNVIDRVEIIENEDFSSKPIFFNENLTCIIGGKSTGKSLLLHNMALALDREQTLRKIEKSATKVKELPSIKVTWRDNHEGKNSSNTDILIETRKIIYIPQTYLNKLSDEREESTEIDTIIQDIILQDDDSYYEHNAMDIAIRGNIEKITSEILQLYSTHQEITKLTAERQEKGDEKGVSIEIEKLENQLAELSKSFQISEQDVADYQKASELVQRYSRLIKVLEDTRNKLAGIQSIIEDLSVDAEDFTTFKEQISDAINETVQESNTIWQSKRDIIISLIDDEICKYKENIPLKQAKIDELQPKISGHGQIAQVSSSITAENQKLSFIKILNEKIATLNKNFESSLKNICIYFFNFREIQNNYLQNVNSRLNTLPSDDLEFRVEVVFRSEHFKQSLAETLNNRTYNHFLFKDILHDPSESGITEQFLIELIRSIISTSQQSLALKNNHDIESGLRKIFTNWYNINYIVKLDDDDIYEMSPGKKALVLLRLLISLAEGKCPILIDQPEDDLDNRSIFGELIEFIKKRKNDRQIIVVTHNANIVVGSDAELVIVANQHGKNSPNSQYKFEYRAGSIENNIPVIEDSNLTQGVLERQGIQGHICDVLEGGVAAFALRGKKYQSLSV